MTSIGEYEEDSWRAVLFPRLARWRWRALQRLTHLLVIGEELRRIDVLLEQGDMQRARAAIALILAHLPRTTEDASV